MVWCNDNHFFSTFPRRDEGDSGGLQERLTPQLLTHWSSTAEEVEIVAGKYKYLGSVIDCKLDWSPNALAALLKKGQPAAVPHEEAEVFQRLPQVAGGVLQVNSGDCRDIQQPLSLRQPQRTGQGKLSKITKTATTEDWQTCPTPPGTLRGESSKAPGGHPS